MILIDDRCPKGSWQEIERLAATDPAILGIRLSRNFGQHAAIQAGLSRAKGEWVIVMDCDLQDRPEEAPRLWAKALEGFDVVRAKRVTRNDPLHRRFLSRTFYALLSYLTDTHQNPEFSNFGIYNRRVIEIITRWEEESKYFPAIVSWVGFSQSTLPVEQDPRFEGRSSYTFRKLLALALNIIIGFSDKPLKIVMTSGFLMALFSFGISFFVLVAHLLGTLTVEGWASMVLSLWFVAGCLMFAVGLTGLYVGRNPRRDKRPSDIYHRSRDHKPTDELDNEKLRPLCRRSPRCFVMTKSGKIVVCAAGMKGFAFVEGLIHKGVQIDFIVTYAQADDHARSFERLRELAADRSIQLLDARRPALRSEDLTFLVGWQHLLSQITSSTVVFHDSLLPRYRGFAPTVTALMNGDREIGVTALQPNDSVDEGPIITQRSLPISYPIKIEAALMLQASLMTDLAIDIVDQWRRDQLSGTPQQENHATYSIWRDEEDYEIDWSSDAQAIERFVDAVGYPYAGARTTVGGIETIRILEVSVVSDMRFEIRDAGKIWKLDDGRPIIVCGAGMVRIEKWRPENGTEFAFQRLRTRLGPARLAL